MPSKTTGEAFWYFVKQLELLCPVEPPFMKDKELCLSFIEIMLLVISFKLQEQASTEASLWLFQYMKQ